MFSTEIWKEIEMIFWKQNLACMPRGAASDGLDPIEIQSTKRGVEIHGGIWFLPGGRGSPNPRYELNLCLARPRFSSIESVTVEKLRSATITESALEEDVIYITIT